MLTFVGWVAIISLKVPVCLSLWALPNENAGYVFYLELNWVPTETD